MQVEPPTPPMVESFSLSRDSKIMDMFKIISEDQKILDSKFTKVLTKLRALRALIFSKLSSTLSSVNKSSEARDLDGLVIAALKNVTIRWILSRKNMVL